jgi:hypothetical protein
VFPGADPGFQVRGGALKKFTPIGGRRENIWGISCEKSRFYAKNRILIISDKKLIQLCDNCHINNGKRKEMESII